MPPKALRSKLVLVVDDEPLVRHFVAKVLTRAGFTAIEAADSLSALNSLKTHAEICVVILDIMMPGMSGLDFANQLAQLGSTREILYMSGYGESIAVEAIQRSRPDRILAKPFRRRELVARVEHLVA